MCLTRVAADGGVMQRVGLAPIVSSAQCRQAAAAERGPLGRAYRGIACIVYCFPFFLAGSPDVTLFPRRALR